MAVKRSSGWAWWLFGLFFLGGVAILGLACISLVAGSAVGDHIGLIELSGAISDGGTRSLLGGASGGAREFVNQCERAELDKSVKAVVIRINSPGGSASSSQEMYQAVMRLRAHKPVICSMGDMAASGGYYVASACDKIYANDSTLTGSIGVISEFMNYSVLAQKLGIDTAVIKSGKFKDAGNPARALTPEEKQLFQAMIMDVYQQFVNDVVAGRKAATGGRLTRPMLLKIADGRVFSGHQALAALLVDANGGLYDAIAEAGRRGHIVGSPHTREVGPGGGLGSLLGAESSATLGATAQGVGAAFAAGMLSQLHSSSASSGLEARYTN